MASTFTHGFVALAFGRISATEKPPPRFWLLGILCSVLPDFDVVAFRLGVPYGHMLGHRGYSHSLLFAVTTAALVMLLAFRDVPLFSKKWRMLSAYFFIVTASHGVLDAMTNGGYGIGFFVPFDNGRYFLPWRPLRVSPIGVFGFLSRWGWDVIRSEFLWIWLPLLAALGCSALLRRSRYAAITR